MKSFSKQLNYIFLLLTILFSNCKKDRRGCLGGNATLTLIPKWEDTNNGGALSSVLGTTLYVWFDGTNADGMFQPKDPSTADVVAIAGNNESTVKIQNLCRGKYGWRIFGKAPAMWKTYMAQGSSIIYWSERKKETVIDVVLH